MSQAVVAPDVALVAILRDGAPIAPSGTTCRRADELLITTAEERSSWLGHAPPRPGRQSAGCAGRGRLDSHASHSTAAYSGSPITRPA
ncbi:hypothetical protein QJS66_04825 [Kocuria rhizophila]|nr:hypothetical protein QJS66_04825 [Kocuria rhizophila]